jgi:photosystem II stability/assembly factor-like uncharacterized protein
MFAPMLYSYQNMSNFATSIHRANGNLPHGSTPHDPRPTTVSTPTIPAAVKNEGTNPIPITALRTFSAPLQNEPTAVLPSTRNNPITKNERTNRIPHHKHANLPHGSTQRYPPPTRASAPTTPTTLKNEGTNPSPTPPSRTFSAPLQSKPTAVPKIDGTNRIPRHKHPIRPLPAPLPRSPRFSDNRSLPFRPRLTPFALALIFAATLPAQFEPNLYHAMRWRQIGPFRAGRVTAVAGIPGNAATYYMGTPGGGVWKTVDGGTVWTPIFDQVPISSVGAVSVAISNPNIVYVGTGDVSMVGGSVNMGNGVYKSTDAGKTWHHAGLDETEHIGNMWVDPTNPDIVLVAALGRTYSKNEQRGVFKTTDGGKTWKKVLYKDDMTGAVDIVFAPGNPKTGYVALMEHYTRPGARAAIESTGTAGVYKTTDGGDTWTQLTEGLPGGRLGRIGLATNNDGQKVFAIVAGGGGGGGGRGGSASGLYRSDDAGAHWNKSTQDPRIQGSGYFSRVFLDPNNSDVVYVAQTSLYRSEDGGKTFSSYKGAPGGDDNHALWIDPKDSLRMIMASDQGATISMDGGKTWSSWYNQPTGQIYHLSTDNRYPYWVYGTQQDSGSVGTLSRGDYGEITFMDWDPVGGYEFGYIVPDPLNNNLVYAGGPSRGLVRIDRTNRQVYTVSPSVSRGDIEYRTAQNPPIGFSPTDQHILYMGTQFLLETRDGGIHWKHLSPDLTVRAAAPTPPPAEPEPPKDGVTPPARPRAQEQQETIAPMNRNAINAFSPSPVAASVIWAGTNNGILQLTKDGGATWQDVSPPGLGPLSLISIVEASHFDAATAYVAVDRHDENDFKPHFYRTHDSGKTWQETNAGIPDGSFARVVREDPVRKGLLYAGTENAAYVSFDEGDHWTSLQLNMPVTSVRDMVIHGDDLVAATYGRAFWILDDVTPLRQIDRTTSSAPVSLFKPEKALRARLDLNQDTPIPPDMPAGQNPPNGAIIDFYLNSAPSEDIKLAIYDNTGKLVRELSTKPEAALNEPPPNVPDYWLGHPEQLTKGSGQNRFVWDLRYAAPPVLRHEYPISALYGNTPALPLGAIVTPGNYKVRLTVNGKTFEQPLTVSMDPRVDVSNEALAQQLSMETNIIGLVANSYESYKNATSLRQTIVELQRSLESKEAKHPERGSPDAAIAALKDFDQKAQRMAGAEGGFGGGGGGRGGRQAPQFAALNRSLGSLANVVDGQDAAPTPVMQTAYEGYCGELSSLAKSWNELMKTDLANLNGELAKQGLSPLAAAPVAVPECK